jgi:hypothetical protein
MRLNTQNAQGWGTRQFVAIGFRKGGHQRDLPLRINDYRIAGHADLSRLQRERADI